MKVENDRETFKSKTDNTTLQPVCHRVVPDATENVIRCGGQVAIHARVQTEHCTAPPPHAHRQTDRQTRGLRADLWPPVEALGRWTVGRMVGGLAAPDGLLSCALR